MLKCINIDKEKNMLPTTRKEALKLGEKYFDTKKPCKHGHLSKRFSHNSNCYQCTQVASLKNYYNIKTDIDKRKKQILQRVEQRANRTGELFNLTVDDLYWPETCPVFGYVLSYEAADKDRSVSLDKHDVTKGYTKGNVVIMSLRANRAKWNLNIDEVKKLYEYLLSKS